MGANEWLTNFAFHIETGWLIFILAPAVLILITLLTISLQSIKAALTNPVKSLRSE
jgi:putative ABC transport system permease protein